LKAAWHGAAWSSPGVAGNDIHKTGLPNIRVVFREECLRRELNEIARCTGAPFRQPLGIFPISVPVADGTWRCDMDALAKLASTMEGNE
jgi:hypothetical protein